MQGDKTLRAFSVAGGIGDLLMSIGGFMSKYTQAITEAIAKVSEERNNKKFNWTEDAILCKLRGCNCKGCKFDELHAISYENKKHGCRLKKHVLNLVKTIGKPEGIPEPTYIEDKDEFE